MGLWRAIVHGFGFTLGAEAAQETMREGKEALDRAEAREKERVATEAAEAKNRARVTAKWVEQEKKLAARREREIDRELVAMKKRIGKR